jgi:hypothetical protein
MAGHETTKSLLDSELLFLRKSQVAPPGPETRVPITARSTAWVTQPTVAETKPLEQVTVKLVAKRQKHASLQQWVARQGGEVLSRQHDGDVVLVNLPTRALGQLETAELIQRAEAPRAMLPRLDEARGAPTRLAEAVSDFPASGDGVVVSSTRVLTGRIPTFRRTRA